MEQITITAKVQIAATDTDKVLLNKTMSVYCDACNYVSDYVFRTHDLKQFSLNKILYSILTSCPAPIIVFNSTFLSNSANSIEAFLFAVSFSPYNNSVGHDILCRELLKSNSIMVSDSKEISFSKSHLLKHGFRHKSKEKFQV